MPRLPAEYATWMGRLWTPDDMKQRYRVDNVRYADEVSKRKQYFFVRYTFGKVH